MANTKNRARLGRGLSSLISVSDLPVEVETPPPTTVTEPSASPVSLAGQPLLVPLESIRPNPHQPRKTIRETAIAELAASLRSTGIIQPLIVRPSGDYYELIAGERRWLAAKLAGFTEAPVIVRDVAAAEQAQMALIENIQREDLNPLERAQGYKTLMDHLGLTQAELANRMGEDRSGIANYLRLLDLAEPVRQLIREGKLTLGHAKLLAGVADVLQQQKLAETVVNQQLSVRNLERLLQSPEISPPTSRANAAHLIDLEKSLARQLGLRVSVKSTGKGKGRLIVHYANLDQFDELMGRLGVKID